MSKARRRVTVDTEKPVSDDSGKRKPSVFERLGPGGAQRKYEEPRSDSQYSDRCRNWLLKGTCTFGSQCKYQHGPLIGKRKSKSSSSRKEDSPDDLRLRVKGHHGDSDSASPDPHVRQKRDEMKIKSTVVVKKSGVHDSGDDTEDSDNWAVEKLDYKKELELEQKRQQLQRELNQLAAMDDERENITIEKKLPKPADHRPISEKSDSDHSPDHGRLAGKKKSPNTPKKEKKRKHKLKSPVSRSPSPSDSPVKGKGHKKKYDKEEDVPHKVKHKKAKKLLRKQLEKSPEIGALRTKKKHSPKQAEEKPNKIGRDLPASKNSPEKALTRSRSPLKSERQKPGYSRSRSRSPYSPAIVPKAKVIPDFVREGLKEGKYRIKKKKDKAKEESPASDHELKAHGSGKKKVSPMKIKKKNKNKHEVPIPKIKDDIEEDLPERHTDSEGRSGSSESYSRRHEEELREQKEREVQELKQRSDRYDRRDRARSPSPKEHGRSAYQDNLEKSKKAAIGAERKRERREEFERNYKNSSQKAERSKYGISPKPYPVDEYASPVTEHRERSPDDRSRLRQDRYKEPERDSRRRDIRPADDRRLPRETAVRTEEFDSRGRSPSTHSRDRGERKDRLDRPGSASVPDRADRYAPSTEYRSGQEPRGRFEEGFSLYPDHPDVDRQRYPGDREQFDSRNGRQRADVNFERGRRDEASRNRFGRLPDERSHVEAFEEFDRPEFSDRSRGARGRRGAYENISPLTYRGRYEGAAFEEDRQNRRADWETRRPAGEAFRTEADWPARPDSRREPPRDERYDSRRDDRRLDNRPFGREVDDPRSRPGEDIRSRSDWRPDSSADSRRPADFREERLNERGRERAGSPGPTVDWAVAREGRAYERGVREDRVAGAAFRDERGSKARRDDRGFRDERDDKRYDSKRIAADDKLGREERGIRDDPLKEERSLRDERQDDRSVLDRSERDASKLREKGNKDVHSRIFDKDSYDSRSRKEERSIKDEVIKGEFAKVERSKDKREDEHKYREKDKHVAEDVSRYDRSDAHSVRDEADRKYKADDVAVKDAKKKGKSHKKGLKRPPRSFDDIDSDDDISEEHDKDLKKDGKLSLSDDKKTRTPDRRSLSPKRIYSPSSKRSRSPLKQNSSPSSKRSHSPSRHKQSPSTKHSRAGSKRERSLDSKHSRSSSRLRRSRSPRHKRPRDVSPAGSHHSRGGDRRSDRSHQPAKRDDESDHDDRRSTAGSLDLERKSRRRGSVTETARKDKARSLSPQTASRKTEDEFSKSETLGKRKRSLSGASKKSHDMKKEETRSKRRRLGDRDSARETKPHLDEEEKKSSVLVSDKKNLHDSDMEGDLGTEPDAEVVVFSDWSEDDDIADNILNKEDEKLNEPPTDEGLRRVKDDRVRRSPSNSSRSSWSSRKSKERGMRASRASVSRYRDEKVKDLNSVLLDSNDRSVEQTEPDVKTAQDQSVEVKKEADVGLPEYESISSSEEEFLEEEAQKPSITDILEIDWSSLNEETRPKPVKSSVLDKFKPASIFSRIGVSRKYAGEELFNKIKDVCEKDMKEMSKQESEQEKSEASEPSKTEEFKLQHDVALLHCCLSRNATQRANLMKDFGPHRQALCARRDLEMRQQLCKVDKVFDQAAVYPSQVMDVDLCKLSIQLFRRSREHTPEKKDSLTRSPSVVSCQS